MMIMTLTKFLHIQGKYIRCIVELLNAQSHPVKYEAATTLIALTSNPTAVKGTVVEQPEC